MRRRALVVLALVAATGCTADDDGQQPPGPAAGRDVRQDPVAPENGTAPAVFVDRDRLPSCGSYAWTLEDEGPPQDVYACLAQAAADGRNAELVVSRPTVDSGPVVVYYRVTDDGSSIEAWLHGVSAGRWTLAECASLDRADGPQSCDAVEEFDPLA